MLRTALTNHVLHAVGVPPRYFWIDICLRQQAGEKTAFFVGLLGYFPAHIYQTEGEVLVRGEETALL